MNPSNKPRLIDRLGGDRRAVFFVIAAAVCALMIPLTPTDPAKKDDAGKVIKAAYSFTYVPVMLICWCLLLAVLSWLDNRARLHQPTPLPARLAERRTDGLHGLAVAGVVLGAVALAVSLWQGGAKLWEGAGIWNVASALALVYGLIARRECRDAQQKGGALAVLATVLGGIGSLILAWWALKWLGNSFETAFDKLRNGEL